MTDQETSIRRHHEGLQNGKLRGFEAKPNPYLRVVAWIIGAVIGGVLVQALMLVMKANL